MKSNLKAAGIDIDQLTGSIEDAGVFAVGTNRNSLGGALILTTNSADEARNTVSNLGLLLRSTQTPGVTAISGKATGFSIRDEDLGKKPLVVAAEGERIAIGYGLPATLTGLKGSSGTTLGDSATFKEAESALGGTPISGFADGVAAVRLAEGLIPQEDKAEFQEAKPYLGKIAFLAIGGESSGETTTAKIILGLK